MREARRLYRELVISIVVWTAVTALILTVLAAGQNRLAVLAGTAAGGATAIGILWHMFRHLDIALDLDARQAQTHMRFAVAKRLIAMGVVFAVALCYPQYLHPLGVIVGLLGLKIAALLHPLVEKALRQKKQKTNK